MQEQGKPSSLHQISYIAALIFGGVAGYRIGNEFGGIVLGIIGAAILAVLCSTIVGAIAIKLFGYKP